MRLILAMLALTCLVGAMLAGAQGKWQAALAFGAAAASWSVLMVKVITRKDGQ